MTCAADNRGAPRLRVAEQGKALLGAQQIWCAVHDLSETGARLEIWSGTTLPAEFDLLLVAQKLTVKAALVWRDGEFAGVTFSRSTLAPQS